MVATLIATIARHTLITLSMKVTTTSLKKAWPLKNSTQATNSNRIFTTDTIRVQSTSLRLKASLRDPQNRLFIKRTPKPGTRSRPELRSKKILVTHRTMGSELAPKNASKLGLSGRRLPLLNRNRMTTIQPKCKTLFKDLVFSLQTRLSLRGKTNSPLLILPGRTERSLIIAKQSPRIL